MAGTSLSHAFSVCIYGHLVVVCGLNGIYICVQCVNNQSNHLQRWLDHNPPLMCFGCIYTWIFMWSATTGQQSDHLNSILIQGIRGSSRWEHVFRDCSDFLAHASGIEGIQWSSRTQRNHAVSTVSVSVFRFLKLLDSLQQTHFMGIWQAGLEYLRQH